MNNFISSILAILLPIFVFCVIIIVHELGHYGAARLFKMKVYEFALGMGPRIFSKKSKKTGIVYSLRAVPFGGFVNLAENETDIEKLKELDEFQENENSSYEPYTKPFTEHPVWQRMIVILAGVFMNFVLGILVCVVVTLLDTPVGTTEINFFRSANSAQQIPEPSSNSKLQANDKIVNIDGLTIFSLTDISYKMLNSTPKTDENFAYYDFKVIRDGEKVLLKDVPFRLNKSSDEESGNSIYFDFKVKGYDPTFINVIKGGFAQSISWSRLIVISLVDMITGKYGFNDFAGPVGVVGEMGNAVKGINFKEATINFLSLAAIISLNLGVMNLLPFPGLDGSRFCFFAIEAVRGKPVNQKIEAWVHATGFILLFGFMIAITFNDIRKLIFKG